MAPAPPGPRGRGRERGRGAGEGPEARVAAGVFGRLGRAGTLRALPEEPPPAREGSAGAAGDRHRGEDPGVAWLDLEPAESRFLLAGCGDGTVTLSDVRAAAAAHRRPGLAALPLAPGPEQAARAHAKSVVSVQWYPVDSGLFVSAGTDGAVKLWDANAFAAVLDIPHPAPVTGAFMSPGATQHCYVATGALDGEVRVADPVHGAFVLTLSGHAGPVTSLTWDPACDWQLFSADADGEVRLWDVRQPGSLASLDRAALRTDPLDFSGYAPGWASGAGGASGGGGPSASPAGGVGGAGGSGGGRGPRRAQGPKPCAHGGPVLALLPGPAESLLSYGADGSVRLWDLTRQTCRLAGSVRPPAGAARRRPVRMCASPDRGYLYVPAGPAVQVRNLRARRNAVPPLEGHFDDARCCCSSGPGGGVLSGGDDGQVLLWEPGAAAPEGEDSDDEDATVENCDAWSDDGEDRDLLRLDPDLLLGAGLSADALF